MAKITNESGIPDDDFHREGLIDRLQQYLEVEPGAWHIRYNLGVALAHDGRLDEALEQFQLVLKESPKHLESMLNLGGIYLSMGEADLALRTFTSALAAWDVPAVRANLAVAYMQKDRLDEAEGELRRALGENPHMPDALTNLSMVMIRKGDFEEAEAAAGKALEINDQFAMAHNNRAVALLELGHKDAASKSALRAQELGYPVHQELLEKLGLS